MAERYLLDTNICIYIAKHNPDSVHERFAQHSANELIMSVISLGELRFGAEKSHAKEQALTVIEELTSLMNIEALTESTAEDYGQIRADLKKSGQIISNNDLWIAAQARSQNWVLITNNKKEFLRVDSLRVENWV